MKPYKIIELGAVDSTNNYARGQVVPIEADEGTVVLAREQLNGRGNGSNSWESESGKNLTFSLHLKPVFLEPARQFFLSMAVSLGVAEFTGKYTGNVSVKWPNDIYVGDRKIAGILIENIVIGNRISDSIIGIGVNINQETFIGDAPNPISLKLATGKDYNLQNCIGEVLDSVFLWYNKLKFSPEDIVRREYLSKLYRINEWAEYKSEGKILTGRIIGIGNYGALQVQTSDMLIQNYGFKEIEFR